MIFHDAVDCHMLWEGGVDFYEHGFANRQASSCTSDNFVFEAVHVDLNVSWEAVTVAKVVHCVSHCALVEGILFWLQVEVDFFAVRTATATYLKGLDVEEVDAWFIGEGERPRNDSPNQAGVHGYVAAEEREVLRFRLEGMDV